MNDIEKAIKTISDIYDDYFRSENDTVNLSHYDEQLLAVHTVLEQALQEKQERDKMVCGNCRHYGACDAGGFCDIAEPMDYCSRFDLKEAMP